MVDKLYIIWCVSRIYFDILNIIVLLGSAIMSLTRGYIINVF